MFYGASTSNKVYLEFVFLCSLLVRLCHQVSDLLIYGCYKNYSRAHLSDLTRNKGKMGFAALEDKGPLVSCVFSMGKGISALKICLQFYEWCHAYALQFNAFVSQVWRTYHKQEVDAYNKIDILSK